MIGFKKTLHAHLIVPGDRRQGLALGNGMRGLYARLLCRHRLAFGAALLFDEWLEGRINFQNPFLELRIRSTLDARTRDPEAIFLT
jgi:hypothetical protein